MKKHISALMTAVALVFSLTISASAAYIPDDVTYQNLNGQQLAIKVYTLLPEQNPEELNEGPFDHDGFHYELSDIVKEENKFDEQDTHTETVTVNTATKNLKDILEQMDPTIEFDDGTWSGTLALDHSTIKTEAAGYKKSSYTVSATKTYTGLDRNDSSYIAPTVVKDGRTLSLSNVTWSVESTALVGDELVPATYAAVATYSGSASSTVATGYVTTADYVGTVTASGISSIQYTATYLGTEIQNGFLDGEGMLPVAIFAAIAALLLILLLLYSLILRTNTTVYHETENDGEYEKCGKLRIRMKEPKLKLDRLKNVPDGMIAVEIDAPAARKLFGKTIDILKNDATFKHTVGRAEGAYWFKLDVSVPVEPETKEEPV